MRTSGRVSRRFGPLDSGLDVTQIELIWPAIRHLFWEKSRGEHDPGEGSLTVGLPLSSVMHFESSEFNMDEPGCVKPPLRLSLPPMAWT